MRRGLLLVLPLLLAAGDSTAQEKPVPAGIEAFLPTTAEVFLSLPDAAAARSILLRLGDSEGAVAARIAARSGADRKAVAAALGELLDAADGPVTFSRHRVRLPSEPVHTELLVSLSSKRGDDRLQEAAMGFLKTGVTKATRVVTERILGVPVAHLVGAGRPLYLARARGFVVVATDPFLLGRLFKEMQEPRGRGLLHRASFAGAAALRRETPGAGLFWMSRSGRPAFAKRLGIAAAAGRLAKVEGGYRDERRIRPASHGLLGRLATSDPIPGAWSEAAKGGIWVGASLTKAGVLSLAVEVLEPDHVMSAMNLDRVATGGVELLWRPGKAPAMAVAVDPGSDRDVAAGPLGNLAATRADGALVVSEDLEGARPLLAAKGNVLPGVEGGARVSAPVPALLGLLGREGAPGKGATSWRIERGDGDVRIRCGAGGIGPVQLVFGALLP